MTALHLDIVRDPTDEVAGARPVSWAMGRLGAAVATRGGSTKVVKAGDARGLGDTVVIAAGARSRQAGEALAAEGVPVPQGPEALALVRTAEGPGLVACGSDARGLTYALLELADRVEHADDPLGALRPTAPVVGRPANAVRSVTRLFCSELEDKSWYHDEAFWERYLSMLAVQRFNRFSLTLGLGYNYHRDVSDAYLYFAYPFLISIPSHAVRVPQLPDEERDRNLAMLRFISEETVARGLDFQLGLWTHAYEWIDSPNAHHTIEGLTPETHGPYCRDALAGLLDACPAIGGLTFRIHGESGVPEGSWEFWRSVFEGVAGCGRRVGIDLHAKGLDERTLGHALDTGLPITVSPKFWAEHMGLPYHQAAIRESERLPREDPSNHSEWHRYMRVSEGSRPFTRYGYGDFLREDRPYDIVFRLWAGTQRVLLWGDPAFAAGYGRVSSIAGTQGLEWCEPLTFKGREGSGLVGSRTGYADPALIPRDDWEKYAYTYRLFGRLTYDPDTPPEVWGRSLRAHFGATSSDAEAALASVSRILPLVTVAHHPSASNNYYWPEIYTDMPIVWTDEGTRPHPYIDTPPPRRFGTVSPLDPEVFSSVIEYVAEFLSGTSSGRLSPVDVASHLERLADEGERRLALVRQGVSRPDAEARRWAVDIAILAALGRFFAGKIRAAVGYELYTKTGSIDVLTDAVNHYRSARRAWQLASSCAGDVYVHDLTFGPQARIRGCWDDRLAAIEGDLRDMETRLTQTAEAHADAPGDVLRAPDGVGQEIEVEHDPPEAIRPGQDLLLTLRARRRDGATVRGALLRYRPMDQALTFAALEMEREADRFTVTIPGTDLDDRYGLAYAFVLRHATGAVRFPGVGPDLAEQPYIVVRVEQQSSAPTTGNGI